jgi:hypothetical protein
MRYLLFLLVAALACGAPTASSDLLSADVALSKHSASPATIGGVTASLVATCRPATDRAQTCTFNATLTPSTAYDHVNWVFGNGHSSLGKRSLSAQERYQIVYLTADGSVYPMTYVATVQVWFADGSATSANACVTIPGGPVPCP